MNLVLLACAQLPVAGEICVTLFSGMVELPTFKTALPLEIETELTVPLTWLPLALSPVTDRPMRLPAEELMFWPSACTDCNVAVNC